jgi:hypothetical protein
MEVSSMNLPLKAAVAVSGLGLAGGMAFLSNAIVPVAPGTALGAAHHTVAAHVVADDDFGPGNVGIPGGVGSL